MVKEHVVQTPSGQWNLTRSKIFGSWTITNPLFAMTSCMELPGRRSGVVDATHSSRSNNNGWWLTCSTLAIMGIKEPRTKLLDSAGPVKSPVGRRGTLQCNWEKLHITETIIEVVVPTQNQYL